MFVSVASMPGSECARRAGAGAPLCPCFDVARKVFALLPQSAGRYRGRGLQWIAALMSHQS
uniref:Uncharacterized protein n=1 Tax=Arundo donax TaxID=35708 RepID=A0A0A9BNI7_ARUDO